MARVQPRVGGALEFQVAKGEIVGVGNGDGTIGGGDGGLMWFWGWMSEGGGSRWRKWNYESGGDGSTAGKTVS